jgi:hypothetical protein
LRLIFLAYWSIFRSAGIYYSEGQGVVTTKGQWLPNSIMENIYAIGHYSGNGQTKSDRGSAFFMSSGELAFLNNIVGVFE